ncbi:hypothetical protein M666_13340 [Cellulophaga baltica 18]|uniref:Lipoprotein n=1 Tax=Cellulophaga baltica 18 TaxID=1348584 RepID=A0AAU8RH93_9FLAO|nr:hypothetical protein M666_13340 [Cellulophaga baltica 18]
MLKSKLSLIIIIIIGFLFLVNCKTERKTKKFQSDLNLKKNLADFTKQMNEKDTVKIFAELNMEWWIRRDELVITKKNNEIRLQATIKEDTTFQMKYQMRINKLPTVILKDTNNALEKHFVNKIGRTKDKTIRQYIYKIMGPNDTLIFYTNGLGDKGGEVRDYYDLMNKYYPNNSEFKLPEVEIEKVDDFRF